MDWSQIFICISLMILINVIFYILNMYHYKEFHGRLCALEEHFRTKHFNRHQ